VHVASPYAGALEKLGVARGQHVEAGAVLFMLEHGAEQAPSTRAVEGSGRRARIANLSAGGASPSSTPSAPRRTAPRPPCASQRSSSTRTNASSVGLRLGSQGRRGARTYARATAQLAETEAQLRTAVQSSDARPRSTPRAPTSRRRGDLAQASVRLEQKTGIAPAAALVQDTYYREGNGWPRKPRGEPLAAANIKVRFFVPNPLSARCAKARR